MPFSKIFGGRSRATPSGRRQVAATVANAAIHQVEQLEPRRLLTTYTYYVPGGTTEVRLGAAPTAGYVYVYLGSDTSPDHTFIDPSGTDVIDAGGQTIVCKDEVPAVDKPSGGIVFTNASGGTLEIDAGVNDTYIELSSSTASGGTITVNDPTDSVEGANDTYGAGVTHLKLVASNAGGATVAVDEGLVSVTSLEIDTGTGTSDTINIGNDVDEYTNNVTVNTGAGSDTVNLINDGDGDAAMTADIDFGAGTGSGDGTGLGNSLSVDFHCTATLVDNADDGHTVVLDTAYVDGILVAADKSTVGSAVIYSDGTLIADASGTTINTLSIQGGTADVEAPTTIHTLYDSGLGGAGTTEFTGSSDASTVYLVSDNGTVDVDYGAVVTVAGSTESVSDESTFNNLNVAGTLYLQSASTVNDLTQSNGITVLDQSGAWTTHPGANSISTINITGGDLDLEKQDVVTSTDQDTIISDILSAYDGGAWDGSGILTKYEATENPGLYVVGYVKSGGAVPSGVTLSDGQLLLRPTVAGDATLDGSTDIDDLDAIESNYLTGSYWTQGDVNYDGSVDVSDLEIWLSNNLNVVDF